MEFNENNPGESFCVVGAAFDELRTFVEYY
jgi:hypothetical protein